MDDLLRNIRIRDILEKYKFKFNKRLGQNFLKDDSTLDTIVNAAGFGHEDSVLEIGPGIGTLTEKIARRAKRVLAIEVDDHLISILNEILKGYDNIELYHGDALKTDLNKLSKKYLEEPFYICANLPYYITTPLISKFFSENLNVSNIVLMVQKEVAERMVAVPGGKDYGALSLLVQYYSKPDIVSIVPPHFFVPSPKVESAIIKLDVYKKPPVYATNVDLFFNVIRYSFNQRRKTLSNALKCMGISKEKLYMAFENSNIDPTRRGETLSICEFASLSNEIYKISAVRGFNS